MLSSRLVLTDRRLEEPRSRLSLIQGSLRRIRSELRDTLVTGRQVEVDVRDGLVPLVLIQQDVRETANIKLALDRQGIVVEYLPALERLEPLTVDHLGDLKDRRLRRLLAQHASVVGQLQDRLNAIRAQRCIELAHIRLTIALREIETLLHQSRGGHRVQTRHIILNADIQIAGLVEEFGALLL